MMYSGPDGGRVDLSVIVPLYNEEESLELLYDSIVTALVPMDRSFEIVFVDDGSSDGTFPLAEAIAGRDGRVRVVKFRNNCGQTPAMAAGIHYARGKILVTMDGDLQNDPLDIPLLVEKMEEGYDLVVGWRHNRQDKWLTRKLPSKIANWLIGKVTGVPIKDNGCSLKAYRAHLIKRIPLYSEMHRFIPAMASMAGARWVEMKVRHHARQFGKSKYGLSRIYKVLLDLVAIRTLLAFSRRPFAWFGILAGLSGLITLFFMIRVIITLAGGHIPYIVVSSGMAVIWGSLTLFLFFIGVLSQLIYRTGTLDIADFSGLSMQSAISTGTSPDRSRPTMNASLEKSPL